MDYIKIPKGAATLPQVAAFAKRLGVHPDHALGMLMRWWATCEDTLDAMMDCPGFAEALRHAGWLHTAEDVMKDAGGAEEKPRRQTRRKKLWEAETQVAEPTPIVEPPPVPKVEQDAGGHREWAETIYLAYPRRVGKPKAIAAILKAFAKNAPVDLGAKTVAYAAAVRGSDPRFIPHPSTWFNEERYNDDPSTWRTGSGGKDLFEGIRQIQQESGNGVPSVFDGSVLEGDGTDPGWYAEDGDS